MGYIDELKKESQLLDDNRVEHADKSAAIKEQIDELKNASGFHTIDMNILPSKGMFYPSNMSIAIRPLRIEECKDITETDESNVLDTYNGFNRVIKQCCRVKYGPTIGDYRDILKCDETVIAYLIRELSYPKATVNITIPAGACSKGCKGNIAAAIRVCDTEFENANIDEDVMKYYDSVNKVFDFKFKNGTSITMKPSTIGSHEKTWNYAVSNEKNHVKYDKAATTIVPLIYRWEEITDKTFFDYSSEMYGWPLEKFAIIRKLSKSVDNFAMELIAKNVVCPECGGQVDVPVTFQDSFEAIFIPNVSGESDYGLI